jgi:hypothetical protein
MKVSMSISLLKGFKKDSDGRKTANSAMITATANMLKKMAIMGLR